MLVAWLCPEEAEPGKCPRVTISVLKQYRKQITERRGNANCSIEGLLTYTSDKKETPGRVKLAKTGKTEYGNTIFADFYDEYFSVCLDSRKFRTEFKHERGREFSVKKEVSDVSETSDYHRSDNPAAAGRFLAQYFKIKGEKDSTTTRNNISKMKSLDKRLSEVQKELEGHDAGLFKPGGRHVRQGRNTMHRFNAEHLDCIRNLKADITATLIKLDEALNRVKRISSCERKTRKSRKDKQQRLKNKRQKQERIDTGMMEMLDAIAPNRADPITEDMIDAQAVRSLNLRKATYVFEHPTTCKPDIWRTG
ncbi:Hypp6803 [Branchiostoma lanceolatum]|uniref:Hypp6803 protein n=1 Tax=Branchiostoma lanceolatum TaxID=7740 RepID=A0A8J9YVK6_BRALA|nr:Hypp6803 [Branchiostoma lanceolatum]